MNPYSVSPKKMVINHMASKELEVEIKVEIKSRDEMVAKLEAAGATFICDLVHKDHYFDRPVVLGSFAKTDEALRVRISNDTTRDIEKIFITYKGPKRDRTTKTREEIEVKVEDADKMLAILKALQFNEVLVVKKYRKLYHHGDISIVVDKVEHLESNYMEVELLATKDADIDGLKKRLFNFLSTLGIEKSASETRSYLELILESLGLIPNS